MKIANDFLLDLATGNSRLSKKWRNKQWRWSDILERCRETLRTRETAAEYARLGREEQSQIKDVGGFVGGFLSEGIRKKANVLHRSMATLDIDYGTNDVWDDFCMDYDCAAMLYSTHKHSKEHPRFRLVIPFSRPVSAAEYEPICRRIAATLGIDLFDTTTYDTCRLFYWPSTSSDAPYVFRHQDGAALDVDEVLASYTDPYDASSWPLGRREGDVVARKIKEVGDPEEKPGLIGAFCRAYSIEDAIDTYLNKVYDPTDKEGRYTYHEGSVAGGLVCYDGKYAYSHHETDPCSHLLCNAFDLVRLHLYGSLDANARTADLTKMPSHKAMLGLASEDRRVKLLLARERRQAAEDDFGGIEDEPEGYSDEWAADLECNKDKEGKYRSTINNIILILENDPAIAGKVRHDLFSGFDSVCGKLPWRDGGGDWTDRDDANLRAWLERNYGITGKDKVYDAMAAVLTRHSFHPVRDYLDGLPQWDGKERLDRLVIDYLGAEDTELNRQMTRKHFVAAVARIYKPGTKHDQCLIMTGPEGVGKSTLLNVMGGDWFNDSVTTTEGKEGMDQLRRCWIIELGELSGIKRSEVENVKAYLSKRVDIYRAAYDRRAASHPRQCVFCGTTNEANFLKGDNGNRRFWVIPIDPSLRKHEDWLERLKADRDQIWAEAVHRYKRGEILYLSPDMEAQARQVQEAYNDDSDDPMVGALQRFLDVPLPSDWGLRSLQRRRQWLKNVGDDPTEAVGSNPRKRVCAMEFLCEFLEVDKGQKDFHYLARKVSNLLRKAQGWKAIGGSRHAEALYGRQRSFERIEVPGEEEDL